MSFRRVIASVAITFNIVSVIVLALLFRLPDAPLWVRNILFASPRVLSELEPEVSRPPEQLVVSTSSSNKRGSSLVTQIQELCSGGATDCAPTTLAAHLATLERTGGCGTYGTQANLVEGVLAGGGCCSDVVKTFLLLAPDLNFTAREVHIPSHTTAEVWDESSRRWIWIDPFIGYQAFGGDQPLSHLDIYQRFRDGRPVKFSLIHSPLPREILPTPNYPGYRPAAYQAIFYTPLNSLHQSAAFSDWLAGIPFPKPARELLLYLTVKPPPARNRFWIQFIPALHGTHGDIGLVAGLAVKLPGPGCAGSRTPQVRCRSKPTGFSNPRRVSRCLSHRHDLRTLQSNPLSNMHVLLQFEA